MAGYSDIYPYPSRPDRSPALAGTAPGHQRVQMQGFALLFVQDNLPDFMQNWPTTSSNPKCIFYLISISLEKIHYLKAKDFFGATNLPGYFLLVTSNVIPVDSFNVLGLSGLADVSVKHNSRNNAQL